MPQSANIRDGERIPIGLELAFDELPFSGGRALKGEPVVETLKRLTSHVEQVVEAFTKYHTTGQIPDFASLVEAHCQIRRRRPIIRIK
jgi:hypothetical protein